MWIQHTHARLAYQCGTADSALWVQHNKAWPASPCGTAGSVVGVRLSRHGSVVSAHPQARLPSPCGTVGTCWSGQRPAGSRGGRSCGRRASLSADEAGWSTACSQTHRAVPLSSGHCRQPVFIMKPQPGSTAGCWKAAAAEACSTARLCMAGCSHPACSQGRLLALHGALPGPGRVLKLGSQNPVAGKNTTHCRAGIISAVPFDGRGGLLSLSSEGAPGTAGCWRGPAAGDAGAPCPAHCSAGASAGAERRSSSPVSRQGTHYQLQWTSTVWPSNSHRGSTDCSQRCLRTNIYKTQDGPSTVQDRGLKRSPYKSAQSAIRHSHYHLEWCGSPTK